MKTLSRLFCIAGVLHKADVVKDVKFDIKTDPDYDTDDGDVEVAIKTPILCLTDRGRLEKELKDFYSEAKLTSNFSHENILHCLGISRG